MCWGLPIINLGTFYESNSNYLICVQCQPTAFSWDCVHNGESQVLHKEGKKMLLWGRACLQLEQETYCSLGCLFSRDIYMLYQLCLLRRKLHWPNPIGCHGVCVCVGGIDIIKLHNRPSDDIDVQSANWVEVNIFQWAFPSKYCLHCKWIFPHVRVRKLKAGAAVPQLVCV